MNPFSSELKEVPALHNGNERPWVVSYEFKGRSKGTTIYAETFEEAKEHLKAMGNGSVDGELVSTIHVPLPRSTPKFFLQMIGDILVRIVAWIKT